MRKRIRANRDTPAWKREAARRMRCDQTPQERAVWAKIRCKQLGFRFLRQVILCGFIADFYSPKIRVVVEVDGSQHRTPEGLEYDGNRDAALSKAGILVLRFTNQEVEKSLDSVVVAIKTACEQRNSL